MAVDIDTLQIEIEASSNEAVSGIDRLAASLEKLRSAAKGGAGLTATTNQMKKLAEASKTLNSVNLGGGKIAQLAQALNSLSSVQKATGLTSTLNALKKLPAITEQLEAADLGRFAAQMDRVTAAVRPLATEMQKVSSGFAAFPIRIQKIIASNSGLAASNSKAGKSFNVFGAGLTGAISKLTIFGFGLRQLSSVMSNWVTESNKYVEDLNLFTVAMGDGAKEAYNYAQAVHEALGIDPAEWMRNQGVFKQITSGFGVVEDRANLMSKNLTQIGYDIASFFNISISESMQKVQSGIAGELEPLRRLGYALDVATLQEIAYKNGINMKVNAMNQAQKSQLRYLAIIEQSGNVMGDMARTIMTPANAMRVLQQQITQLTRALGNLLIPFLIKVIPYVQAFVEVLTEAIQRLAVMVGFELPEIDYSGFEGISGGASDAEDAMDGATKAAKELKNAVLGIDELNILAPQKGSTGGAGNIGGTELGITLPDYDFLKGLQSKTKEIKKQMEEILDVVLKIGTGLLAWKIANKVVTEISNIRNGLTDIKGLKLAAGITLMVSGLTLEAMGAYDLGYNGPSLKSVIKTAIGGSLGVAGSLLVFGTGPMGWTIGLFAALTVGISSFTIGYSKRKLEEEIKRRFGEIEFTLEEAKNLAENIMSSPLAIQLSMFADTKISAETAIDNYLKSSDSFNHLVWKVSIGLEVDEDVLLSSVDDMVSSAQSFLNSQRENYLLAINIGFSDVNIQAEMAQFVNTYFSESEGEMERLGEELKQTMLDALADGIIDKQEMQTIANLQSEMNQILATVANAEYKAKLTNAVYELDGELSYDSVKMVSEELAIIAQEQIDSLGEVHLQALTAIELKYQTDGNYDEYTAAIENEMKTYFENQAMVSTTAFQPLIGKFNNAFSDALSESQSAFDTPMENLITSTFQIFEKDETGRLVDGSIHDFMNSVKDMWWRGFNNLDVTPEVESALKETLAALEPTAEQLQKIADDARAAGEKVPEGVSNGLSDYYKLSAITGDIDAINYLLGEKLSTDPNFIEALQTAEDAGEKITGKIAEGLTDHIDVIKNANGTVSIIGDAIGTKVLEITPTLIENLSDLGVSMSTGLLNGADNEIKSRVDEMARIGGFVATGIAKGMKKANVDSEIKGFTNDFLNKTRKYAEINSPSRLFRDEVGIYLGLGIAEGLSESVRPIVKEANSLADSITGVFDGMAFNIPATFEANGKLPLAPKVAPFTNGESAQRIVRSIGQRTAVSSDSQSGLSDGVADGNSDVVNAVFAMASMVVQAIESKDTNIYLDKQRVGRALNETQKQLSREAGASFVKRGV